MFALCITHNHASEQPNPSHVSDSLRALLPNESDSIRRPAPHASLPAPRHTGRGGEEGVKQNELRF